MTRCTHAPNLADQTLPARRKQPACGLAGVIAAGLLSFATVTTAYAVEPAAQAVPAPVLLENGGGEHAAPSDHIDPVMRAELLANARSVRAELGLDVPRVAGGKALAQARAFVPGALPNGTTQLSWPVRSGADNRTDFQAEVSNYVDLDAAPNALRDYACGTRTYDTPAGYNHDGIDISSWPFPWTTMDADGLDVVAAADGVIVTKIDGRADRSCTINTNAQWNLIVLAHSDGNQTLYGHMKRESLTSKSVGDAVVAGEYLGQVGSSGVSTGPHLHFELLDANDNPLDPFAGACGAADSHWRWQPEYDRSRINAVLIGNAAPVIGQCNGSEVPNLDAEFVAGDPIYVSGYFVNQRANDAAQLQLIQPNGSVWLDVPMGSPAEHYEFSYWYRSVIAPSIPGQWRARITLNGETSETGFSIGEPVTAGGVVAAVLPGSRSVGLGQPASIFATMANGGATELLGCRILPLGPFAGQVSFQATDPATNALTGAVNQPVAIAVGGSRSFVVTVSPNVAVAPSTLEFNFKCNNAPRAMSVRGLNTLQFSAAATAPADIVPVSATATADGVVRLGESTGAAAFATAAVNIGTTASAVSVTPQAQDLALSLSVCETNAAGGCAEAPAASLSADFGSTARTFSVFVTGTGEEISFDPQNNRVELVFEHAGVVRGVTSVAVTTD